MVAEQATTRGKLERLKMDAEEGVRVRGRRYPTPEEWDQMRIETKGLITAKEYKFSEDYWGEQIDEKELSGDEEQS